MERKKELLAPNGEHYKIFVGSVKVLYNLSSFKNWQRYSAVSLSASPELSFVGFGDSGLTCVDQHFQNKQEDEKEGGTGNKLEQLNEK